MEKWPGSNEPNEAGFSLAYHTDQPMMDIINRDPRRSQRMAGAMTLTQSGPAYSLNGLLNNYDWGDAVQGTLVDVGGSEGTVAIQVARHFPEIRCIVQDLPKVIAGGKVPDDLKDGERLVFMAHDFFTPQPVEAADVYLLRWILHDWSDAYAIKILQNLVPALKTGSRILVLELCLPLPGTLSPYRERSTR